MGGLSTTKRWKLPRATAASPFAAGASAIPARRSTHSGFGAVDARACLEGEFSVARSAPAWPGGPSAPCVPRLGRRPRAADLDRLLSLATRADGRRLNPQACPSAPAGADTTQRHKHVAVCTHASPNVIASCAPVAGRHCHDDRRRWRWPGWVRRSGRPTWTWRACRSSPWRLMALGAVLAVPGGRGRDLGARASGYTGASPGGCRGAHLSPSCCWPRRRYRWRSPIALGPLIAYWRDIAAPGSRIRGLGIGQRPVGAGLHAGHGCPAGAGARGRRGRRGGARLRPAAGVAAAPAAPPPSSCRRSGALLVGGLIGGQLGWRRRHRAIGAQRRSLDPDDGRRRRPGPHARPGPARTAPCGRRPGARGRCRGRGPRWSCWLSAHAVASGGKERDTAMDLDAASLQGLDDITREQALLDAADRLHRTTPPVRRF